MVWFVYLLISLVIGIYCHMMAKRHGRNPVFWGVMGVTFGPFAIPFIFFIPEKRHDGKAGGK